MKFLVIGGIDLSQNKETEIQLQYIEKCKELLAKNSTKCPMHTAVWTSAMSTNSATGVRKGYT